MIPRTAYPTKPWPLAKLAQHPCLPFLIVDSNNPETKLSRARDLQAVMAVLDHVRNNPAAYAEPRPVAKVLDAVPGMPLRYDAGAIINELERMKLFAIEHSDDGAMLVPAESATAAPVQTKAKPVTVSGKVSADLAAQFRAAASRNGTNANALIAQFIADYVAANV